MSPAPFPRLGRGRARRQASGRATAVLGAGQRALDSLVAVSARATRFFTAV